MDSDGISRRRLLGTTGTLGLVGLTGCLGGGNGAETDEQDNQGGGERDRSLPEGAENCVSTMGVERESGSLNAKENVGYQFHPNYTGESGFIELCANCRFFCTGAQFGTEIGACALVEGGIYSQDWCALWQPVDYIQELENSGARTLGANPNQNGSDGNATQNGNENNSTQNESGGG